MTTSKSPKAVARIAYAAAKQSFSPYRHLKSPKKFTQHQLIACLALKEFFKTDYRGISTILEDSSDLRKVLELSEIPHYTTLQKAAQRLTGRKEMRKLIGGILDIARKEKFLKKTIHLSAVDSTGFESHHTSTYFVRRKAKTGNGIQETTYTRFPKVGIVVDCATRLVLAGIPSWGPSPDILHWKTAIKETRKQTKFRILTADAGYDSEEAHRYAREERGIRSIIPNRVGRPTTKLPSGKYRKIMATRFNKKLYGQRWQVETVNSMLKRLLGSFLRARSYWSQMREIMLRLFTFNAMIVWHIV